MIFFMKLNSQPFEMIKNGQKTIELRLNDEKRQQLNTGDEIIFANIQNTSETLKTQIIKIYKFSSFKELYLNLPLEQCGYTNENIKNAKSEDMDFYYSKEKQNKYGVLGIEIKRL